MATAISVFVVSFSTIHAWVQYPSTVVLARNHYSWQLQQQKRRDDEPSGGGYKFGDLTRGLLKRTQGKVNDLTGKDSYEFGDLSRWADQKAKERVRNARGDATRTNDDGAYHYQLGDVSRWATDFAKEKAAQYAGKKGSEDYVFGDISRTIFAKVRSGDYQLDDVYLALRVLVTAGFSILPVANLLPVKLLLQLVEFDLAKDVGGKLTGVLASSVDARVKEALTGDANYQLGDLSKSKLNEVVSSFTGKDSYEFGDISKALAQRGTETKQPDSPITQKLEKDLPSEFAEWDKMFLSDQDQKKSRREDGT